MDHNAFQADLGKLYSTRVVGCIDHHEEEYFVPLAEKCEGEPRIVRKSGSCASLVVEYCRGAWDALSSEKTDEMKLWNSDLAKLALAPVLIDTNCLTSESKTTAADVQAVEYLESWIRANEGEKYYREGYFKEITSAKEDILFLSLPDILRKDYKQWTASASMKLGVSSIVKNVRSLMQKAGGEKAFLNMVRKFAEERELSIVSIMTTSHVDGVFRRELLVWALDAKGVKAAKRFEVDSREKLGLQKWGEGSLGLEDEKQWRRCWWQHRVDNSRKQVAPLLRSSIEETA